MTQISPKTDEKLNKLSRKISEAEDLIETGTLQKDVSWSQVYDLFEEHNLEGVQARFIADDGHILYKEPRTGSPKLDEDKLRTKIYKHYDKDEADIIWNSITVQKVDDQALEAAIQSGHLEAKIANACITPGKITFARIHNKWSKEDKERATMLGVTKEE